MANPHIRPMPTNNPSPTPTPKSAFPRWLKRLNPALEAEYSNGVYQAFREHRIRRQKKIRLKAIKSFAAAVVSIFLGYFLVNELMRSGALAISQQTLLTLSIVILLLIFGAISVFWYFKIMTPGSHRLPSSSFILVDFPLYRSALLDVWMTGAGGRELAEANYLEICESLTGQPWRIFVVSQIPLFFLCLLANAAYPFTSPASLPVTLSCAALSPILFCFVYQMAHATAVENTHLRLIQRRISALGRSGQIRENSKFIMRTLLLVFIPALIGLGFTLILGPPGSKGALGLNFKLDPEALHAFCLKYAPAIPILFAIIIAFRWRANFRRDAERIRAILDASAMPTELFIEVSILGKDDPDSRQWAESRWGKDLLAPNLPKPRKYFGLF